MLRGILPIEAKRVPADLMAGITLAALAIPEVLGYTKISGTPVITGLYTILIPMALYALFGASRQLVVGADSATAAILASSVALLAAPRSAEWLALSGILALMAAGLLLLARLARLGFLADFLSRTVLVGFLTGVGIQVALGEISGMLGLPGGGHGSIGKLRADLGQMAAINYTALELSAAVLLIALAARKISSKLPGMLIAVVGAIVASRALRLESYGLKVLGAVPSGLPRIALPAARLDWALIQQLMPTAFALFIVILAQSAATSRAFAARHGERLDENADLLGLALANLGAGLSGTFVVNGSPTKTQIVDGAGARSQLSQLTTTLIVLLVLLFLTGPLAYLPEAALSSVVFLIGVELVDAKGIARIYAERRWEFWVALITAAVVVFVGVEQSILLAIVLSLVVHTRHGYRPNNLLMAPDRDRGWRLQPVTSKVQALPGLIIYRFMHSMYYANSQVLSQEIAELVEGASPPLSWFCIDAVAVNDVDFTAAEALRTLQGSLSGKGIKLVLCEVARDIQEELERSGICELLGPESFFHSPGEVTEAYRRIGGH